MMMEPDLVVRIRDEAEIAARHRQTGRLDAMAYEVADLIALVERLRKELESSTA